MTRRATLAASCALAAGALGATCEEAGPVLSSEISTRDMRLVYDVTCDEAETRLEVYVGGPGGGVLLDEGDRLVFSVADVDTPLARRGAGEYGATGPFADGPVALRLDRAAPDEPVRVDATLPAWTPLTSPAAFSRAQGLSVSWQPVGDAALPPPSLVLEGPCVAPIARTLSGDPGTYTFQPADFPRTGADCAVTVTLTRALDLPRAPLVASASGRALRVSRVQTWSTP